MYNAEPQLVGLAKAGIPTMKLTFSLWGGQRAMFVASFLRPGVLISRRPALQLQPGKLRCRATRTGGLKVSAELRTSRGTRYFPEQLNLKQSIGEGSFGEVFEGVLNGKNGDQRVVLKRVKDKVQGAAEMHEMEHLLTVYASKAAKESVADFLGFCEVDEARGRLSRGLWLVWAYQGNKTLAYYLKRRDCTEALARDLGVPEEIVVPTVMRHIFHCLEDIHSAGMVHRDIKPANIILCERDRRFKLIDLGAACDLRSGTNYRPTETILDPCYCPPEEYVLPTDAPHLSRQAAPLALAMSPLLWSQHRPDCFDTYSAGIVLMQLALPTLRRVSDLRNFRQSLARNNHELQEWRSRAFMSARTTVLLDANDGEGWSLAEGLLRPRKVETDDAGNVRFVSRGSAPRLTAAAALKHPFVKRAFTASSGGRSAFSSLLSTLSNSSSSEVDDDLIPADPTPATGRGKSRTGRSNKSQPATSSAETSSSASASTAKRSGGSRWFGGWGRQAAPVAEEAPAPAAPPPQSLWQRMVNKLYDLEARVNAESSATEVQTTLVQELRGKVATGRAAPEALAREEGILAGMQQGLQDSMKELRGLYGSAAKLLGSSSSPSPAAPPADEAAPASSSKQVAKQGRTKSSSAQEAQRTKGASDPAGEAVVAAATPGTTTKGGGLVGGLSAVGRAAGSVMYAGMKFTGLAVHVAGTLAEAVRSDAEKALKEAQEEAAALREASQAFLDAVQQLEPPVRAGTSYDDVARLIPNAAAYSMLSEGRRRQAFNAYVDGLRRAERLARQRAAAEFQAMLSAEVAVSQITWEEFVAECGGDARFRAVPEVEIRRATFDNHVAQLRSQEEAAARQQQQEEAGQRQLLATAEYDFRQLLQQQEHLIRGGAGWPQVKRSMWADPRFDSVAEERRRELFEEYCALMAEAGELPAQQEGPVKAELEADVALVGAKLAPAGSGEEGEDSAQLVQLKVEQERLKEEYDRLESKLREMESHFQVQQGEDSTLYRFDAPPQQGRDPSPVNGVQVKGRN